MRKKGLTILLVALSLILSGCRVTGEVENQAYVLALGLDRTPTGQLALTARVPQIGKGSGSEDSGGGYLRFSATGESWPQAVEALEQATPRPLNMSHIELLVSSEALAGEADFANLISRVAETPHLYTTARFVVCEGRASDFIDGMEAVIGTRLSAELEAMLEHYAENGYIPDSSFAEAYYAVNSIYGDAVAIQGSIERVQEAASITSPGPMDDEASPMKQRYSGAALFKEGRFVGTLDASQTMLLNLIRGDCGALPVECGGKRYSLTLEQAARSASIDGDALSLRVELRFSTPDDVCAEDAQVLEQTMQDEAVAVVVACQRLGTEPFGFAEQAAKRFPTLAAWSAYDWRSRYPSAGVEVSASIHAASAQ